MPSFKVGTGIRKVGTCDAYITGERSRFDYGQKVWCLYRHGACKQLSSGNFKLYRDNVLKDTWSFPSYWGYVYVWYQNLSPGNYKVVCTIGSVVMTKYFTIEEPTPTTGSIRVTSSPTGASVYLNNVYKGTTTKEIENLNPGTYSVKVTKTGYNDKTKSVTVYANQSTSTHFTLTAIPQYGALNVTSSPTGAAIAVDGKYKGTTPQYIDNLTPGTHSVGVSKAGYLPQTRTVIVIADASLPVHFTLSAVCSCTSWINKECISNTQRRQTRTCTPSGCATEERTVNDPTCVRPPAAFHFEYLSKTERATPGQHVEAKIRIYNDSNFAIEIKGYIMDGDNEIEKEPDIGWKNIGVGKSTDLTLSTYGPSPDMPNHNWHLNIKVCARDKGWF